MKRIILVLSIFILCSSNLKAQKKAPPVFDGYHKNITTEFFGSHLRFGVNYDMRLRKGKMDGVGFRVGVGGINVGQFGQDKSLETVLVTFPIEFNHLVGKRRSSLVTGIGILPVYAAVNNNEDVFSVRVVDEEGFGIAGGFLTLGYRFQPLRNGLTFQMNWNPLIIRKEGFLAGWFGVSLGFAFK